MTPRLHRAVRPVPLGMLIAIGSLAGCTGSGSPPTDAPGASDRTMSDTTDAAPPPATRAWMDRLTVAHEYDPKTGFIVARETVPLPALIAQGPTLDNAVATAGADRIVVAFATADRCAPCQQYKKDALNNPDVLARLSQPRFIPTHVEVDQAPQLADTYLGSRGIPMTYALRQGRVIAVLRGQRSPAELAHWLDALPG